jgi:hypothetical protein
VPEQGEASASKRKRAPDENARLVSLALMAPDGMGSTVRRLAEVTGLPRGTVHDTLERMERGEHGEVAQRLARMHRETRTLGAQPRSRHRLRLPDALPDSLPDTETA